MEATALIIHTEAISINITGNTSGHGATVAPKSGIARVGTNTRDKASMNLAVRLPQI